ncbi:methyl-accepting chemotaxis protein [uncultured Roseobacter sp.]|uniref:methyl-accepting chemotaxis protein n=1 Tax=uncultured Roseobacter sp. TaxID=114847 RepID=UPI0026154A82|nr:methyl-accepting chemotaxis protein [uncultured Roseobacter sp.]
MTRLALIVGAMGIMIGAAVYLSWTVFQSIEHQMQSMSDERLPQLRASADIAIATDETRALLTNILIAKNREELQTLQKDNAEVVAAFQGTLDALPADQRDNATALLDDAEAALLALLAARVDEQQARADAMLTLEAAFGTANAVSGRLEEATDTALFDMTLSGEAATSSLDETLTNLVERDFAQFQTVLGIQAEVNLLTGLALTLQQGGGSAARSITTDLGQSSVDRLTGLLDVASGMDGLADVTAMVSDALETYRRAFAGVGAPPAQSEILELRLTVDGVLTPAVDNVYFDLVIRSEEAKETSQTALSSLMETEVAAMQDMAALDASTKAFFSLALKTALARTPTELGLAQGELSESATIVRSLMADVADPATIADVEQLLALADPQTGIATNRSAVFAAQLAAAQAAADASQSVGAIAQETAAFSSGAVGSIQEAADILGMDVQAAGAQITQIGMIGLALVLVAPVLVWLFVTRPLNRVTVITERLAGGDLSEIDGVPQNNGELGRLGKALHVFRENALQTIQMREEEKRREAAALEEERAAEKERQVAAAEQKKREEEKEQELSRQAEAQKQKMIDDLSASIGSVVSAASDGDFTKRIEVSFDDQALEGLADGVNALVQKVDEGLSETARVLSRVARGDLTEMMVGQFSGAFASLQNDTNGMIDGLRDLITDISGSGANLAGSSSELLETSDALSKQAEQNAASLEETSAALEELTASIKQVSQNVSEANTNAGIARDTAESSGTVAADAAEAMTKIADASAEIGKVVTVINDIAFQINLLALNAGVEAARAGEAGRGFSVVASEVRQLAQRAGEAATEIDEVIARSDTAVSEGVSKVTDAKESLAKIADSVVSVSDRIGQISVAIDEQVHGISEINSAVSQIDSNTQKQAASFEEVTAASSLLSTEAAGLKQSTSRFKTSSDSNAGAQAPSTQENAVQHAEAKKSVPVPTPASGNLAEDLDGWDEF